MCGTQIECTCQVGVITECIVSLQSGCNSSTISDWLCRIISLQPWVVFSMLKAWVILTQLSHLKMDNLSTIWHSACFYFRHIIEWVRFYPVRFLLHRLSYLIKFSVVWQIMIVCSFKFWYYLQGDLFKIMLPYCFLCLYFTSGGPAKESVLPRGASKTTFTDLVPDVEYSVMLVAFDSSTESVPVSGKFTSK